jgi:hypothetical protein
LEKRKKLQLEKISNQLSVNLDSKKFSLNAASLSGA